MKPTVVILGIHLPEQKIILTSGPVDALQRVHIPSSLKGISDVLKMHTNRSNTKHKGRSQVLHQISYIVKAT
jgi:hypothetical protein